MSSELPKHPSLEYLKKQARQRLSELQAQTPGSQLADAQHAVAREHGFSSWPKLKAQVDAAARPASSSHAEASDDGSVRAIAVHFTDSRRAGAFGVAVLVPAVHYAAILIDDGGDARTRRMTRAVWREVDRWATAGDSGLPRRPAPLSPAVVTALLGSKRPTINGRRVASFPLKASSAVALNSIVMRLLPRLLQSP